MFGLFQSWKRKRLADTPFPPEWEPYLEPLRFLDTMAPEELARFRTQLKVFVWEKSWYGAGGACVTDEMKVTIAACAARMVRNLPLDMYAKLREIVVYPGHYRHPDEDDFTVYGEAHHFGTIVLSWDAVKKGLRTRHDGRDTALHEFAHALDVADGWFDGTPELERGADYRDWTRVMGEHFARLRRAADGDGSAGGARDHVLRDYGALNEAEFFAVATEAFFEKPGALRRRAPELYEELHAFYGVDPDRPNP